MRINRKEAICDAAAQLFNQKGYDQVSMREIAKHAGTTIGNLTYYFPKKEDIVIQIVSELHEDFQIYLNAELSGVDLLKDLILSYKKVEETEHRFPFYFKNLNDLVKSSDYFKSKGFDFQIKLYNYYNSCFITLQNADIINKEFSAEELRILSLSFTAQTAGWLMECMPFYNEGLTPVPISKNLSVLLKPYIVKDYMDLYQELLDEILSIS